MKKNAEFVINDIPWPQGMGILANVATHRRKGSSVAGSVARGIVEESHDLFRNSLPIIPQRSDLISEQRFPPLS